MAKQRISGADAERLIVAGQRIQEAGMRLRDATEKASAETPSAFDPRELRMALDGISLGHSALVALLIEQGTVTGCTYLESLAECMEEEADDAEDPSGGNDA